MYGGRRLRHGGGRVALAVPTMGALVVTVIIIVLVIDHGEVLHTEPVRLGIPRSGAENER